MRLLGYADRPLVWRRRESPVKSPVCCTDAPRTDPHTYRIISRGAAAYCVGFSLLWFGGIVGFVLIGELTRDWTTANVAAAVGALLIALVPALLTASIPYGATLTDDGVCEFRSLLHQRRVRVNQIRSIRSDENCIYIRHDRGKVRVLTVISFKELLIRLVELNPAIELEDWLRREVEGDSQMFAT